MKILLIGLAILGLTTLALSQDNTHIIKKIKLEDVIETPMKNVNYCQVV